MKKGYDLSGTCRIEGSLSCGVPLSVRPVKAPFPDPMSAAMIVLAVLKISNSRSSNQSPVPWAGTISAQIEADSEVGCELSISSILRFSSSPLGASILSQRWGNSMVDLCVVIDLGSSDCVQEIGRCLISGREEQQNWSKWIHRFD